MLSLILNLEIYHDARLLFKHLDKEKRAYYLQQQGLHYEEVYHHNKTV